MSSTKLLLLTTEFPPQPGGIGNHAHNLAKSLVSHDFEVTVLTDQRSKDGVDEEIFDELLPYKVFRIERKTILLITYLQRVKRALKLTKKHDLVLVSGKFSLWIAGMLRFFTRKPFVAVIHGTEVAIPTSLKKSFTKWCLKRCNIVIAVSNYTKSLVQDWGVQHIHVIPNGFSIYTPRPLHSKLSDVFRLITVGNVTQRKGQHNVIKALPMLLERFPKLQYDIVGIPTEKDNLDALARQLGVQSAVVFHKKVSEEEKIELLQQATIFIMLSETTTAGDIEGFGIAILEANALGIPAIGARGCGIEDAILHNASGILVDPHAPEEVFAAVSTILESRNKFIEASKDWSKKFTWDKISVQYVELLKR